VLPLRHHEAVLPFAALAIGSIIPDLPYYLPGLRWLGGMTHTAWAILSLDLALGIGVWALWRWLGPALHELAPGPIRSRWRPMSARPAWWAAPLAVTIGTTSHVVIDEFTHAGRLGATHLAVLAAQYPSPLGGSWEGFRWAQYLGGALGLAILAWAAWRLPPQPVRSQQPRLARWLLWTATAAALIGACIAITRAGGLSISLRAVAFSGLTGGIGATGTIVIGLATVHRMRQKWPGSLGSSTGPVVD